VLTTLRRSGEPYELTPGQLVTASMVTSGAITKRIDRMVAKDLVERIPDTTDRRIVRIRLTAHGRKVIDDLFAAHIANEVRLLQALDREQADQLADALRVLLVSFGDTSLT
jgi:DNA-binding MarR family transcriptional regulator